MTQVPASASAKRIVDLLRARDGIATTVQLTGGRTCTVLNIAWGQDDADPEFHVTTNVSPRGGQAVDHFTTSEVVGLRDPETGERLL